MKSYDLETTMNFGKYKGKTLREILTANPNYVNWCLINVDYFHISNSTLTEIEINEPCFKLNKEAIEFLQKFLENAPRLIEIIGVQEGLLAFDDTKNIYRNMALT